MARKKQVESVIEQPEQTEQPVVEQPVVEQPVVELETKPVDEPIYLRETLMEMDEIKHYGLNKYFLRAILKDKYYTLSMAKELVEKALRG